MIARCGLRFTDYKDCAGRGDGDGDGWCAFIFTATRKLTVWYTPKMAVPKRPHTASAASAGKPHTGVKSVQNNKGSNSKRTARKPDSAATGEKKAKKSLPKKKKKKAPKVEKSRDFVGDLETYLEEWSDREQTGTWKFNKILQAWTLDNCFSKKKMPSALFKQAIPYLLTVQGGAMDRLVSRAAAIMSTDKSDIVDDEVESTVPATEQDGDNDDADDDADEEDEEGKSTTKKKQVVTKSMVSRAKKLQKALNA
jgi:hypothetical protein